MAKIVYVGNFERLSVGEPEVAEALEELGHKVIRIEEKQPIDILKKAIIGADMLLFAKFRIGTLKERKEFLKELTIPKVCWVFDLYWGLGHEEALI